MKQLMTSTHGAGGKNTSRIGIKEGFPMSDADPNRRENPRNQPLATMSRTQRLWGRPLAIATAVVFSISSIFPAVAGLSKDTGSFPRWWGVADVALAFVLAILAFGVMAAAQGREDGLVIDTTYRAYRVLIHGIFAMLVLFFLLGDRIVWINCLSGFAWRAWLLLYILPAWFATLRAASARFAA